MRCHFPIAIAVIASLATCLLPNVTAAPQDKTPLSFPLPPQQNTSWTIPTGKDAEGFPKTLLEATQTLFAQGLADPRGGEYQVITVEVGNAWSGKSMIVETHGWVFPAEKDGKLFAACWNGLIYPVIARKEVADLQADTEKLLRRYDDQLQKKGPGFVADFYRTEPTSEDESLSLESPSLLKVAYLLRLGEYDLARKVYSLWNEKPRFGSSGDLMRDRYLSLAAQWTWMMYSRALGAYIRGADSLATTDSAFLTRIQPLIETEAGKRFYTVDYNGNTRDGNKPYLSFLENLPILQQEAMHRLAEKPRPLLDWNALKNLQQTERIAELIRRMDEINAQQEQSTNRLGVERDPISEALIAEGDAAVEPLLDVMEKDTRWTRLVELGQKDIRSCELLPVKSVAFACFARITGVTEIGPGKRTNAALREWWAKNKTLSTTERWFTQLADNGTPFTAPPPAPNETYIDRGTREKAKRDLEEAYRRRWYEAAARIVERGEMQRRGLWPVIPRQGPMPPLSPFDGKSLRSRQNPSVSNLLRTRALQLSEPVEGASDSDRLRGVQVALMLYDWDPTGRDTLPALQETMRRCLELANKRKAQGIQPDKVQLAGYIARLTKARLQLGDTAAATEYEKWLLACSPENFSNDIHSAFFALLTDPNNPTLRSVADTLFNEANGQPNAWNQILATPKTQGSYYACELMGTRMLRFPAFRQLVAHRLSDTTEAGFLRQGIISWFDGAMEGARLVGYTAEQPHSLRLCDRVALALQNLKGVPRFDPLASVSERNSQCAAIANYLQHYGTTLEYPTERHRPLYIFDMYPTRRNNLAPAFLILSRPATEADVHESRAIFHLTGNRVRTVTDLPGALPLVAQWTNDPNPATSLNANGDKVQWSHGYIWQAEEVYDGKKWIRYYGYVGPHSIAKVPAEEIKLIPPRK